MIPLLLITRLTGIKLFTSCFTEVDACDYFSIDFTDGKGKEQSIMQGSENIKELLKFNGIETS